jgi:hypothetical protein
MAGTSGIELRVQEVPFKASSHDIISIPKVERRVSQTKKKKKKKKYYSSHRFTTHK